MTVQGGVLAEMGAFDSSASCLFNTHSENGYFGEAVMHVHEYKSLQQFKNALSDHHYSSSGRVLRRLLDKIFLSSMSRAYATQVMPNCA